MSTKIHGAVASCVGIDFGAIFPWAENASAPPLPGRHLQASRRPCSSAPPRLCPARLETASARGRSRRAHGRLGSMPWRAPPTHASASRDRRQFCTRAGRTVSSSRRGKGAKSPEISFVKSAAPSPMHAPRSLRQGCNPSPPPAGQLEFSNLKVWSFFVPPRIAQERKNRT